MSYDELPSVQELSLILRSSFPAVLGDLELHLKEVDGAPLWLDDDGNVQASCHFYEFTREHGERELMSIYEYDQLLVPAAHRSSTQRVVAYLRAWCKVAMTKTDVEFFFINFGFAFPQALEQAELNSEEDFIEALQEQWGLTPLYPGPPEAVLALERLCYLPVTEPGDGELTDSKFSGRPWLAADESWPVCPNCEKPMQLFAQLNCATLPSAEQERLGVFDGLIQLFYCTNDEPLCEVDCEAYFPFAASCVARRVADYSGPANETAQGPQEPFPAHVIREWQPRPDLPGLTELYEMGFEFEPDEEELLCEVELTQGGDKLGGWPYWIQGVEYPSCPTCGQQMALVLQIDSHYQHLPYMFGDMGTAHLTQCLTHPDQLAFGWACC